MNQKELPLTPLQLERFASIPRFGRYLNVCGNHSDAARLYEANVRVSMAYYPLLSLFETFFRNRINEELTTHYADADWIINQRAAGGFMTSRYRCYMNHKTGQVITKLQSEGIAVTSGKLISEQTLGFWTLFFDPNYYGLVRGRVIRCFPNRPRSTVKRLQIFEKLERIRELRNRVYHNEPICFSAGQLDFSQARQVHQDVLDLFEWIHPAAKAYADTFDNVIAEIDAY